MKNYFYKYLDFNENHLNDGVFSDLCRQNLFDSKGILNNLRRKTRTIVIYFLVINEFNLKFYRHYVANIFKSKFVRNRFFVING